MARMMPPQNEAGAKINKETGMTEATLYKWRSQDKFLVVMETFAMNETELADYYRRKGLYRERIEA